MLRTTGLILILYFLSLTQVICGQDIDYTRQVIKKLTSTEFGGRGYANEEDKVAANYIEHEYDSLGLSYFGKGYLQAFPISVNTFPSVVQFSANGRVLKTGEDYHVDPGSPSIAGTYKTLYLRPNELLNTKILEGRLRKSKGRFIVLEEFDPSFYSVEQIRKIESNRQLIMYGPDIPAIGVIELTSNKLTWFASVRQFERPVIRLRISSLETEIEVVELDIEARFLSEYTTHNVIGYIEGEKSDSIILISAHYDHLGMMGKEVIFPGANDNASGVALMLDLARNYSLVKPPNTIVFIAFSGEELGLRGSAHFVEHPLFPLSKIKFMLNFDIAGTGDEGIQIVNGSIFTKQFDLISQINADHQLLPQVRVRGEACNSDHCLFYRKGVPSFFIYTLGGIQAYHDVYDREDTLPLTNYNAYFELLVRFIDKL